MGALPIDIRQPSFYKGFMEAGKPYYPFPKTDTELIQLVGELMDDPNETPEQFARNVGFLLGMFCYASDVQINTQESDQKEPSSIEPKQIL